MKSPKRSAVLTDKLVGGLKKERAAYQVWDDRGLQSGLAALVQPSGSKAFYAFYTYGRGRMGSHKLGDATTMTVAAARAKSIEARNRVAAGLDPRGNDPRKALSWEELLDEWHKKKQEGKKTGDATKSFVKFHTGPWFKRPAPAIQTREIDSLVHAIKVGTAKRKAAPGSALRLYTHLVTIFAWAVRTAQVGFVKNPMAGIDAPCEAVVRNLPWFNGTEADEAVRKVWEAAGTLDRDEALFVKLLLLVPKRRNAIQAMRWEQIDANWHWRPIPGSRNKKNMDCTLPQLARRILGARKDIGPVMVVGDWRMQQLVKEIRKLTGVDTWIWHGVRHICATKLEEVPEDGGLGIAPHIARLVLDHPGAGDVHQGYVHATYRKPVADALEAWAAYVVATVAADDKVRVLR